MKDYIQQRVKSSADYIIQTHSTIRQTAKYFNTSKSTTANDMTIRLPIINNYIYLKVTSIIADNKADRHNRGGQATHNKYKELEVI